MILVNNNNGPSQVIVSQAIAMVMDSTEGDVDVHSHVVLIVTTMMTSLTCASTYPSSSARVIRKTTSHGC